MSFATPDERYFASLINAARTDLGLDPVRLEVHLNAAADDHSDWMLRRDAFSHTGAGGSSSRERIEAAGFDLAGGWMTAENIAYVGISGAGNLRDEIRSLHQMLMDSPSHYANITDPDATVVGIGLKVGTFTSGGRDYRVLMATQDFADTDGDLRLDNGRLARGDLPRPDLAGTSRSDWRDGFDGREIRTRDDSEVATGSMRADDFRGQAAADRAHGRGGDDWLAGRGGNDRLDGGGGRDHLSGGRGADRLSGGDGHDELSGGGGRDVISGGAGRDLARGGNGADRVFGRSGNDSLLGQDGADRLIGGAGDDWLSGGAGGDRLIGGGGNDTLTGGTGDDVLIGGGGEDCFVFMAGDGSDRIVGYTPGVDRLMIDIDLTGRDAAGFAAEYMRQTDDGLVISLADGDRIVLIGDDLDPLSVAADILAV